MFFWSKRLALLCVLIVLAIGACSSNGELCTEDSDCKEAQHYCKVVEGKCVQDCKLPIDCKVDENCSDTGRCVPKIGTCQLNAERRCVGGKMRWYDSCGFQQDIAEDCGADGCDDTGCKRPAIQCGDGSCQVGEDCVSCAQDCPCQGGKTCDAATAKCLDANANCGNGTCDTAQGESCASCPADCKCAADQICDAQTSSCVASTKLCGNGTCDAAKGENCSSCPGDCKCATGQGCDNGQCKVLCGNGVCERSKNENCSTCASDCKCNTGEKCDAGQCKPDLRCGDGNCDDSQGENCQTCAQDCKCNSGQQCSNGLCVVSCGNGQCQASLNENCSTCPQDCKCTSNQNCSSGQCKTCVCKPGDRRCSGKSIQQCNANCLGYSTIQSCSGSQQCKNGSCQASCGNGSCDAGENCNTCAQDCKCSSNQYCNAGSCQSCTCTPGSRRCFGGKVQECNVDCRSYKLIEECKSSDNRTCNSVTKKCQCKTVAGCSSSTYFDYRCVSANKTDREYCSKNGFGCYYWRKSTLPCTNGEKCVKGDCCVCTPGEKRCSGRDLQECKSTCDGWTTLETCELANSQYCSTLYKSCRCSFSTCSSSTYADYRCSSTGVREFCSKNSKGCYRWVESAFPCEATETCVGGKCQ